MKHNNYHEEVNKKNIKKLRQLLEKLPTFCGQFFRGVDHIYGSRTKIAYAYDLGVFFEFLHCHHPIGMTIDIIDYPLMILDRVSREDIENYLEYLSLYSITDTIKSEITNEERGKSRKLASLRSFYNYYFKNELINGIFVLINIYPVLPCKVFVG